MVRLKTEDVEENKKRGSTCSGSGRWQPEEREESPCHREGLRKGEGVLENWESDPNRRVVPEAWA